MLVKPPSNLDMRLKAEISEVEILPWVIEPGFSPDIDASGNAA
jgi:hypothetical protein